MAFRVRGDAALVLSGADIDETETPPLRPTPSAPTSGHRWQIDVVRLLTFAAVISVHSLAFTEQPDNRVAAGMMMLLQFGREVFFTLTAFVLVYSTLGRPGRRGRFWVKRILYVAVPYVVWSGIYYAYSVYGPQNLRPTLAGFANDLLYGGAMYHLYFLLVTLQLYIVFPALMAFVRRTSRWAWPILATVAAANLAWLAAVQWIPAPSGWAWWWDHSYELLPSYSMYVLAGAYAAIHLPRLQRVADRYPRRLATVAGICAAGALAAYAAQLSSMAPRRAAAVLQPATTLSCVAALIAVYLIGSRWAAGPRRRSSLVAWLSDLSFGVYLSHPLVLQLLLDHGLANGHQKIPAPLATAVGFAAAVAGGVTISALMRRTPLSLPLTGRARRRVAPPPSVHPARLNRLAGFARVGGAVSHPSNSRVFEPVQVRQEGIRT